MKTGTMTIVASVLAITAAPALAGRDEFLIRQVAQTVAAKRAAQFDLASQAQQAQTSRDETGVLGSPGPTMEDSRVASFKRPRPDHP
jgi:hypothetical protein